MRKKIKVLAFVLVLVFGIFYACSTPDSQTENSVNEGLHLKVTESGMDALINLNTYGLKSFVVTDIDHNNVRYDVVFGNLGSKTFYCETTATTKRIFETTGLKRAIVFDNNNETIEFFENGQLSDPSRTNFQDLALVAVGGIRNGNLNHIEYPEISQRCIHTAISVRWRKSLSESLAQSLIDDFLADHPDCTQLGGIDTACTFGDFGCVSIGEISCASSGC